MSPRVRTFTAMTVVRMTPAELAALRDAAQKDDRTVSSLLRLAVRAYLDSASRETP